MTNENEIGKKMGCGKCNFYKSTYCLNHCDMRLSVPQEVIEIENLLRKNIDSIGFIGEVQEIAMLFYSSGYVRRDDIVREIEGRVNKLSELDHEYRDIEGYVISKNQVLRILAGVGKGSK